MYDDVESDFWKEQISQMQKNNLAHKKFDRLYISDCEKEFENFKILHPELVIETTFSASYSTLEFFVTEDVKFRLFVQNQTKGSFLQKKDGDLVKIADAKFPNNPFMEINAFLKNQVEIKKEISRLKENALINRKKQKVVGEFIKAYCMHVFDDKFVWSLDYQKYDFLLTVEKKTLYDEKKGEKLQFTVSCNNYKKEITNIIKNTK